MWGEDERKDDAKAAPVPGATDDAAAPATTADRAAADGSTIDARYKSAVAMGLALLEPAPEVGAVPSRRDVARSRAAQKYFATPLPFVIGTVEFDEDENAGLVESGDEADEAADHSDESEGETAFSN